MALLSCMKTSSVNPTYNVLYTYIVGEVSLKLGLLFALSPVSFTTLTTWSYQRSLTIDSKGLLIHTSKGCNLDVHPAGIFYKTGVTNQHCCCYAVCKMSFKRSHYDSGLVKAFFFYSFAHVSQPYFFIQFHH